MMQNTMPSGRKKSPDIVLLVSIGSLLSIGLVAFTSASLGLLARGGEPVGNIVANQFFFGVGLGLVAFTLCAFTHYTVWRTCAPYLYVAALILTTLVLLPTLGLEHGGSRRWLLIGPLSLQPSEPLKIGLIFALAAYFTHIRQRVDEWRYGIGGFLAISAPAVILLLLQPDHGTLGVLLVTGGAMFIAAGAPLKHLLALSIVGILLAGIVLSFNPYTRDRVSTFLRPTTDPGGSSYQIQQSLLAIGSGELTGRGYGRSIQKFQYLPEPVGDSIFAVIGEEFGFAGTALVIILFVVFFMRGYSIAAHSMDFFGGLLAVGIITYIGMHFLFNIGSMIGLMPLTGIPLIFISQGGTALLVALGSVGILVNISRSRHSRRT